MRRFLKLVGAAVTISSVVVFLLTVGNLVLADISEPGVFKSVLWLSSLSALLGAGLFSNRFLLENWRHPYRYFRGDWPGKAEERIQQKIIKEVLEAARLRATETRKEKQTAAILDALEGVVDLPRDEIEKIAAKVRGKGTRSPSGTTLADKIRRFDRSILPWLTGLLGVMTFLLIRRGSALYLVTGTLLILAIVNLLLIHQSPKDK